MPDKRVLCLAMRAAFPKTLPILAAFLFLGITYGVYMHASGFSFWYPMLIGATVFAGSMEFVAVNLLLGAFSPLQALGLTLMVNARHLFYGLSMLEKYRGMGVKKPYLMFGLCDETFSINYSVRVPEGVDRGWFYFFVTLFNQIYWVSGATLGGLFGSFIPFDTKGLGFVLTAMFIVIYLDQFLREESHASALQATLSAFPALSSLARRTFSYPPCWAYCLS